MKGCLIMTVVAISIIVISVLVHNPIDENPPLKSDENVIENLDTDTSIDWVESGSVEFFAEQGEEEYELKRSSLKRYFNAEDYAEYLYNSPNSIKETFLGKTIVIHGEVDNINQTGDSLRIEVLFYEGDKSRWGKFIFDNDVFPFAKGCQPGDYVLIKGTVKRISGFANFTDLESSKIHYNFGPLEK